MSAPRQPLEQVTSIKLKLGLLVVVSVSVAAVLATIGAGTVPALLAVPVTVVLALGVTQLLAVGMTSPLGQMTEAVRRMAAGDYDVRVDTASTDEVGQLARAFNRMAADLASVDRQRRDLVANVSHELRTPLAALVAVLENLDDGVTEPDPATIRTALAQAERLSALVRDLLDLSRIDAGVTPLERSEVSLSQLLGEVVTETRSTPREVSFEVRVEPPTLTAYADPARLHQLVANLLDNAARHSPAGATVRVWAGTHAGTTRIEVADEGSGIALADRERVFERFGTLEDRSGGGTGLGLAIARWVTTLHGGRISVVDPLPGSTGARLRVDLPPRPTPSTPSALPASGRTAAMTAYNPPAPAPRPVPAGPSLSDATFGDMWPDKGVPARPAVLLTCLGVGVLAGIVLPYVTPGLGVTLVLLLAGGVVLAVSRHRRSAFTWACVVLCAAFAVMVTLRDAAWLVTLGLVVSLVLVTTALTAGRSLAGMLLGAVSWPLAGLRGMPWLGRTLRTMSPGSKTGPILRTAAISAAAVLVFTLLFASADAIVSTWVGFLVPDLGENLVFRVFTAVAVAGVVLAAAYLAINPPRVDTPTTRRAAQHRFEWLAPVLLVDAVFVVFLAAQAAAVFGGHGYVRRTTGLTYADYVHQGFAQLTIATVLTLLVVWAAARKAGPTALDKRWLRGSLGALCLLTLVVVGSALYRMDLYQDAYGFTRLRLLVDVFEGWLGLVVVMVVVAGIGLRASWLPRAALLTGAAAILGLGILNPDAWIARHNLDRYEATGKVDWSYLEGLSHDAVPTFADRAPVVLPCLGTHDDHHWAAFNLSRWRGDDLIHQLHVEQARCP